MQKAQEVIELFPYQRTGAQWLSTQTMALLADDMGLGKSAQCITACEISNLRRVLVLTPAAARINWLREFQRFSSERRLHLIVDKKLHPETYCPDLTISSYDLASSIPAHNHFDALILDEAHYLKSVGTIRTKTVFGVKGLVRRSKRIWAVSGTPMPNHPGELWVLLYSFGQTKLKYDDFVERYCTYYTTQHGRHITGAKSFSIPELRGLITPIMLRRKKEDVLKDLPPIHYAHLVVERNPVDLECNSSFIQYVFPTDKTKFLKEKLEAENSILASVARAFNLDTRAPNQETSNQTFVALEAIAKSVSTLRRYTGLQKIKATLDLVKEELTNKAYEKVVIFAIHRDVIKSLREGLTDFNAVTIYGNTLPETRQKNIDNFQNNPKFKVLIGNIGAAGIAITLTAAHNVIMCESSFCPSANAQAIMRCHRIGQTKPVFVRFLGLRDSIDDKITQVLKMKTRQITEIFDGVSHDLLPIRNNVV